MNSQPRSSKNIGFHSCIITSIVVIKFSLFYLLYKSGFIAISADEYSRTIKAFYWMKNPRLVFEGIWLPFGYYLEGTVLYFWRELFLAPRVTTLIASMLAIMAVYFLSLALFRSRKVGLFAVCLSLFHPVVNWYSYLPFVCMYHVASVLWALTFFAFWQRTRHIKFLILTSIVFLISSGFRYESWFFIGPYCAYVFFLALKSFKEKSKQGFVYLLAAVIPVVFCFAWILVSLFHSGHFLNAHYLREQYLVQMKSLHKQGSFLSLFMVFPKIFISKHFIIIIILTFCFVPIFVLLRKLKSNRILSSKVILFHCGFTISAFLILCGYTARTSPPLHEDRIIILYFLSLIPFAGFVLSLVFDSDLLVDKIRTVYALRLLVIAFVAVILASQAKAVFKYPPNFLVDETHLGFDIRKTTEADPLAADEKVLLQLNYWGYRGVAVGSNNPEMFIFDGPVNPLENHGKNLSAIKKDHKSVFRFSPKVIAGYLRQNNVKYVVLKGNQFAQKLRSATKVRILSKRGHWYLLKVEK